jgi:hypothetical protein
MAPEWISRLARPAQLDAIRLRDVNGNGRCELMLGDGDQSLLLTLSAAGTWHALPYRLPPGVRLAREGKRDAGLRFVDVDRDGHDDCVFSDGSSYSLHLFDAASTGWARCVLARRRNGPVSNHVVIPPIIRPDGSNNGVWFHSGHLWAQNEDTDRLPDKVDRLAFKDLLRPATSHGIEPRGPRPAE